MKEGRGGTRRTGVVMGRKKRWEEKREWTRRMGGTRRLGIVMTCSSKKPTEIKANRKNDWACTLPCAGLRVSTLM